MKLYALLWRLIFVLGFIAFIGAAPFFKVALTESASMEAPLIMMGHGALATFGMAVWISISSRPTIYARSRVWLHLFFVLSFILIVYQQVGFESSLELEYFGIVEPRTRVLPLWLPYFIPTTIVMLTVSIKAFLRTRRVSKGVAIRVRSFRVRYITRVVIFFLKIPPLIFLSLAAIVYLGEAAMSGRTFAEILDVEFQVRVLIFCSVTFLLFFNICDRLGGVLSATIFVVGLGYVAFFGEPSVADAWSSGRLPWQAKTAVAVYFFSLMWILVDSMFVARIERGLNDLVAAIEGIRSL